MDIDPDALEVMAGVAGWAAPFLKGDDVPVFGSPEWLALDPCDERRASAVVRAALAWWRMGEPTEDVEARAEQAAQAQARCAISEAEPWKDLAYAPTQAELRRRRVQSTEGRNDHAGGPVEPW